MTHPRHVAVRLVRRHLHPTRPSSSSASDAEMRSDEHASGHTSAPGLVVTSSYNRGTYRIDVDGELDLATVGLLDAAVDGAYQPKPWRRNVPDLVLDLTDVTFLDAVALASLLRVDELGQRHGKLRIGIPAHPGPRRLLALAVDHDWLPPVFRPGSPSGYPQDRG